MQLRYSYRLYPTPGQQVSLAQKDLSRKQKGSANREKARVKVARAHAKVADRRLARLGVEPLYGAVNPLTFMELQDVQELSNFFERRVSAYRVG
jgi:transposase